jgi:hypothetical protein
MRATSISLCHDATWQKIGSGYAGQNSCSRSSNGSERPFPKSMQALFLNFCYRSLPHIRIDFIEDYFGSTTFLTARPFAVLCRKLL